MTVHPPLLRHVDVRGPADSLRHFGRGGAGGLFAIGRHAERAHRRPGRTHNGAMDTCCAPKDSKREQLSADQLLPSTEAVHSFNLCRPSSRVLRNYQNGNFSLPCGWWQIVTAARQWSQNGKVPVHTCAFVAGWERVARCCHSRKLPGIPSAASAASFTSVQPHMRGSNTHSANGQRQAGVKPRARRQRQSNSCSSWPRPPPGASDRLGYE